MNTFSVLDTGESTGFSLSTLITTDEVSADGIKKSSAVDLTLLPAEKSFKQLIRNFDDYRPVETPAEEKKFKNDINNYFTGSGSERTRSYIDFEKFTLDWNKQVDDHQSKNKSTTTTTDASQMIWRKSQKHLEKYYKLMMDKANIENTMSSIRSEDRDLSTSFRIETDNLPIDGSFFVPVVPEKEKMQRLPQLSTVSTTPTIAAPAPPINKTKKTSKTKVYAVWSFLSWNSMA